MPKSKPHRRLEHQFHAAGKKLVAGVDEAGKGAWAGPLVAGAVILDDAFESKLVNDSKQLTAKQRELMFVHITHHALSWAVAVIPPAEIDRDGISAANRQALESAVRKLHIAPQAVLIDAVNMKIGKLPVKSVIHGDAISLSIAAASIVAKVVRDSLMDGEHRLYPQYNFAAHKGYGTAAHEQALKKHGPSPIHRQSFAPLKNPGKKISTKKSPRRTRLIAKKTTKKK